MLAATLLVLGFVGVTPGWTATAPPPPPVTMISAVEGAQFSGTLATISGCSVTAATIDWGDGTPTSPGSVTTDPQTGNSTISGAHPYAEEGTWPGTISYSGTRACAGTRQFTATVSDAALSLTGAPVSATAGTPFIAPVATLQDADPGGAAGDYTASVAWGDGTTSAASVSALASGGFSLQGGHTYASAGSFTVHIVSTDAGGATAAVDTMAVVAAPPPPPPPAPPVAGKSANVRVLSGTVFVKLPAHAGSARAAGAQAGFVPLKGISAVPMGSTIDARTGSLSLATAADYRGASDPRHRVQTGTFSVAMFTIKQELARAQRHHRRPPPVTDLLLTNPAAAVAAANCRPSGSPGIGVVRSLTGVAKGVFKTVAAGSTTIVTNATWIVQDRCDGTLTEVGRGRATVTVARKGHRTRRVVVRAGRAFFVKNRFPRPQVGKGLG